MTSDIDLTGKLLIAMPGMGDPRFEHSLVFMCAHSDEGAMGLVINKPTTDLRLSDLLDQLTISPGDDMRKPAGAFRRAGRTWPGFRAA